MKKRKLWIGALAALGVLLVTYVTMVYNDYNQVFHYYRKPAFSINRDEAYQAYYDCLDARENPIEQGHDIFVINSGLFQGIGYAVELSGSFRPYSELSYEATVETSNGELVTVQRGENEAILAPETREILNPVPGVLQARFILFGKEIARMERDYPAADFVPRGFEFRPIF